ncbi:SMP-30/gluconolactonase/LRE family protein [Roseovarius aestuarii]|nr:SMP-30/gluconolactonase/LRE family protein [Roseovarius aestuarii]
MSELLVCIYEAQNILAECPVWNEAEQALYWVDITGKLLQRYDINTKGYDKWDLPDEFGSYAFRQNGKGLIAGTRNGFCLFDLASGNIEQLEQPEADLPQNRMNDGKCDPVGRFWCGSIHEVSNPSHRQPLASVYRVGTDLKHDKMRGEVKTSNGFAWSPDGKTMYFTDTPTLRILAFDYDLLDGTVANERVFAALPDNDGRPDGACVDVEGCLWSAHFAGSKVTRYSPDGKILQVIDLPVSQVTSCAFGGENMSTLFITTAREDMTEEDIRREPLAGGIFAIETDTTGVPVSGFAG